MTALARLLPPFRTLMATYWLSIAALHGASLSLYLGSHSLISGVATLACAGLALQAARLWTWGLRGLTFTARRTSRRAVFTSLQSHAALTVSLFVPTHGPGSVPWLFDLGEAAPQIRALVLLALTLGVLMRGAHELLRSQEASQG